MWRLALALWLLPTLALAAGEEAPSCAGAHALYTDGQGWSLVISSPQEGSAAVTLSRSGGTALAGTVAAGADAAPELALKAEEKPIYRGFLYGIEGKATGYARLFGDGADALLLTPGLGQALVEHDHHPSTDVFALTPCPQAEVAVAPAKPASPMSGTYDLNGPPDCDDSAITLSERTITFPGEEGCEIKGLVAKDAASLVVTFGTDCRAAADPQGGAPAAAEITLQWKSVDELSIAGAPHDDLNGTYRRCAP